MNLPEVKDEDLINAYNDCLALNFNSPDEMTFQNLFQFLVKSPAFAIYGFHEGFGKLLFNQLMSQNRSARSIAHKLAKCHVLGIRDPVFMQLAMQFIDQQAEQHVQNNVAYVILYDWWDLKNKKQHR